MGITAVIVQARMGSTRLPGKVLKPLGGMTALAQCLRRCQAIPGVDRVVCAVPEGTDDDPVAAEAAKSGVHITRGSAADVLARYHKAAVEIGAQWIMRVTSDCPLIDPGLCGRIINAVKSEGADYGCNNMPPSWPHGLDAEVFTFDALNRAFQSATQPAEREHVTPWIRNHPAFAKVNVPMHGADLSAIRMTLDYPEDYAFFVEVFKRLPPAPAIPTIDAVLSVLEAHPELTAINGMHHR